MALSASAPPHTMKAIIKSLHLKSPLQVLHGLDRPNIYLSWCKSKGMALSYIARGCCVIIQVLVLL